jgi:hypothetical protein
MITLYIEGYGYSKRLCQDVVNWFASKHFPRHKLEIDIIHRGLKREGIVGSCDITEPSCRPRSFIIEMHTHLDKKLYIRTLIHEMYHVLQWVKGELKLKASKLHYNDECVDDLEYWQKPHEIQAHWHEKILFKEYLKDRQLTDL